MEHFNDSSERDINDILREIQRRNDLFAEVPFVADVLPESDTKVIRYGDVDNFKAFNHKQGTNPEFQGTCGLVSCEDVLKQFGHNDLTEQTLIDFAVEHELCRVSDNPAASGGTTVFDQKNILNAHDVPSHIELVSDFESLASYIEQGRGLIMEVNAGVLWNEPAAYDFGNANHAVVLTGYARNAETGSIEGFYINDSGRGFPSDSGRFIKADTFEEAFLNSGGMCVVTDTVHH